MKKLKLFLFALVAFFVVGFAVNVNAEGEGLTIDALASKKFTGNKIQPNLTNKVKYDGVVLAEGTYTVEYSVDESVPDNNAMLEENSLPLNAGIYVVTVKYTPEGGTEQTAVGSFEVTKYQVKVDTQKAMATLTDLSESKEVDAEVYWLKSSKRQVLTKGVDYTVSYTYKTAAGEETTPDLLVKGDKVVINVTMINGNFSDNSGTATVQHATASAVKDGVTTYYNNIGNATSYAESGSTIYLLEDYSTGSAYSIKDKSFVIDLNGHTLTFANSESAGLTFENYDEPAKITLTIKNGTIKNTVEGQYGVELENHYVKDGGFVELTLAKDLIIEAPYGIMFDLDYSLGTTVNVYSKVIGSIAGLYLTGVQTSLENAPVINIGEDADISGIDGAYIAGYAKMTVADGAKISGTAAAVEIRAGELTINGGTFISTYDGETVVVTPNGSGSTTQGAAIAVAQHTTALPINVTINGGTFNGIAAVYESNPQENEYADISKVSMSITGGTFNATSNDPVHSEDLAGFISGGTYNVSPDNVHVVKGFHIFNDAGIYVVRSNDISKAVVSGIKTQTYNGKKQTQTSLVVKLNGVTLVKDVDYTVGYSYLINAGTIKMTIKGIGDYEGKITKTFVRYKVKNPLKFTYNNKIVYYSKVKKSAQVVKPIYVSKKVGTLTYTKMSGSSAKLLLNKTTGKVTVKKGTPKGKYKIRIKVYASGNVNYYSNYAIRTIYVTVK